MKDWVFPTFRPAFGCPFASKATCDSVVERSENNRQVGKGNTS